MTTRRLSSLRFLAGACVILAASFSLVGCDEAYSSLVQYTLRVDPLAMSDKFGEEQAEPDRPGILPILTAQDVFNPDNPMFPKRDVLFKTGVLRDPTLVPLDDQGKIKGQLEEWFGTPRNPRVANAPSSLDLDEKRLAEGSSLYRVHCLHCHGVNGDGRGVTARWVNPHPRDFRQGLFKFQSVDQTGGISPPRREDLKRTLLVGVEGTAMPAFNLLTAKQIDNLVSYVIHLSLRGQVEFDTIKNGYEFDPEANTLEFAADDDSVVDYMQKIYDVALRKWDKAQTKPIKVKPYPFPEGVENEEYKASVQRGYNYFLGNITKDTPEAKGTNCVSCHVNFGRQSNFKWDSWGTLAKPNNLTNGIYRGGRRTLDIYYRIHSGINGSNMPAFGSFENSNPKVVWDLVNFIQVLPYPAMREKLGLTIE